LRVIFVMREEYIAGLDPYAFLITDHLQTRFRIEKLNRNSALRAITGPVEITNRHFAPGVAEQIVDNLLSVSITDVSGEKRSIKGEHVEAVQLQVVCDTLWQSLSSDKDVITVDDVRSIGDVDTALSDFYERSIQKVIEETQVKEGFLREWFDKALITPSGTLATIYRAEEEAGGLKNAAVDLLEGFHLLRSEVRGGARWYELSHDRFIKPVLESNKKWFAQFSELEQKRSRLEVRALEWIRLGTGGGLLSINELSETQAVTSDLVAMGVGYSEATSALIAASQSALESSKSNQRALIYALVALTVIAVVIAAIGWLR
jgi:hypothetical protein